MRLVKRAIVAGAVFGVLIIACGGQIFLSALKTKYFSREPYPGYWRIHPDYVYSIIPTNTLEKVPNDQSIYRPHGRSLRSWVPPNGFLGSLRHLPSSASTNYVGFSRTGKYLAIEITNGPMIIWDVQNKKEISRFRATNGRNTNLLHWGEMDRFVTLGQTYGDVGDTFRVWDPETGKVILRAPGWAYTSASNPDGSALVTLVKSSERGIGAHATHLRIFETKKWTYRDVAVPQLSGGQILCDQYGWMAVSALVWPLEKRILELGRSDRNCSWDGTEPKDGGSFVTAINPQTGERSARKLMNSRPRDNLFGVQKTLGQFRPNWVTGATALQHGFVLDSNEPSLMGGQRDDLNGPGRSVLSLDGKYLYITEVSNLFIPKERLSKKRYGRIINVRSGQIVGRFPAGDPIQSIDISPDGRLLALGSGVGVDIYRLK